MKIPTPITFEPADPHASERIGELPRTGVYALASPGKPPYLSWSLHLQRRLSRLLGLSGAVSSAAIARLRGNLSSVECWSTGSRLETSLLLYELSKLHYPADYVTRLRLRMPWFLGLTGDAFPRLKVVNRISHHDRLLLGPFANRDAAQTYEQQTAGLFQIRRCADPLAPAPDHPGCIYGEMNQCLRPCQCAVTIEEYGAEVARVSEFLSTNGRSSMTLLAAARDRACEETEFEQAAQIHKRLEKLKEAAGARDAVVTDVYRFNGVALTRASTPRNLLLWPMLEGFWQEPIALDFSAEEPGAISLDQNIRKRLNDALSTARKTGKRVEELAIFSRWYYSSWRDGDWFPFRTIADLAYRRLVRQISNLVKEEAV